MKPPSQQGSAAESPSVYLSYNTGEAEAVQRIAERLRKDGIDVWLDRWRIKPGDRWQDLIEEARRSAAWVVFLGPQGLPLVVIVLKKGGVRARVAFDEKLTHYNHEIPALF